MKVATSTRLVTLDRPPVGPGPCKCGTIVLVPILPPAPQASSDAARRVMQANRSDSTVERHLRSELHRRGYRFRKHAALLPGVRRRVDLAFPRARVAVF